MALNVFAQPQLGSPHYLSLLTIHRVLGVRYSSGTKASWGPGGAPTPKVSEEPPTFLRKLVRVLLRCRLRILACDA
jgi:hypothetical protein